SGPWWDFFEMVEKAPGKRQLTEKLMPVLRGGGLDVPKLLRTANTAQVLPALVTEYGRPDERHWLWRHLHEILSDTAPATLQHRYRCARQDRKSTRLNSSHVKISYAVFCLKKKKKRH